ncbi:MAG: family 1 glycosylhydrolase [Anaerolineales bacterium]|nr:family 1 glycosylhydrolase [Anaerolineales bacterium]
MQNITFPEDFIWGTATSAYQVEGAYIWKDSAYAFQSYIKNNGFDL